MDTSREQRNNLVYKLWLDSDAIYQWNDFKLSRMYVQEALERVDAPNLLYFGVFRQNDNGLTPIGKSARGPEAIYRVLDELEHE